VWSSELGVPLAQIGSDDFGIAKSVVFDALRRFVAAGYHSGHVRLFAVDTGMVHFNGYLLRLYITRYFHMFLIINSYRLYLNVK
jgi:hypothetical protein